MDLAEDLDESIDFGGGIVEIKTGTGRGFDAELAHQGLVAMVAAAQGDAALVGDGDEVVSVDIF